MFGFAGGLGAGVAAPLPVAGGLGKTGAGGNSLPVTGGIAGGVDG